MDVLTLKSKVKLDCIRCEKCCIYRGDIRISPLNLCQISKFLNITTKEFLEKYTDRLYGNLLEIVLKTVKKEKPGFNIWCYSGYTLEELEARNDAVTNEVLKEIDVLVDGEFVEAKKVPGLKFRGSANQRILDMPKCIRENKIVEVPV